MNAHRAVVVGGASGIGAAVARRLRATGTEVLVWDIAGPRDLTCDVSDPDSIASAVAATVGDFGVPDSVTVTAGVGHSATLLDASVDEWDRVFATNTRGVWLVMRGLARTMLDAEGGSIVAVSSVSGRLADRTMGLYCASKAALDMLIRVAAAEWAPSLRVNGIAPGVTETPMLGPAPRERGWLRDVAGRTAMGRLGDAGEVAEAVVMMHSMSWVTGQVLACDGGLSLQSPIAPPTGRRQA